MAWTVIGERENDQLVDNDGKVGVYLTGELNKSTEIKEWRGEGQMIGMEFAELVKSIRSKLIYDQKMLTGASGTNVIRLLPPLTLSIDEANEFLTRFAKILSN